MGFYYWLRRQICPVQAIWQKKWKPKMTTVLASVLYQINWRCWLRSILHTDSSLYSTGIVRVKERLQVRTFYHCLTLAVALPLLGLAWHVLCNAKTKASFLFLWGNRETPQAASVGQQWGNNRGNCTSFLSIRKGLDDKCPAAKTIKNIFDFLIIPAFPTESPATINIFLH